MEKATWYSTPPFHQASQDGNTEWLVEGLTKRKVLEILAFPQRVPKPTGSPAYTIRQTPDMGLGLFATRNIKVGELILAERPMLVTPRGIFMSSETRAKLMNSVDLWHLDKLNWHLSVLFASAYLASMLLERPTNSVQNTSSSPGAWLSH